LVLEKSFKKIQRNKRLINVAEVARRLDISQPYGRCRLVGERKNKERLNQILDLLDSELKAING
jgi:hypothetical protein